MAWLFSSTLFVSAALLFSVQPMVAKMLLPLLGGAPAVWTTCMLFYQGTLLLGYLLAHGLSQKASRWQQVAVLAVLFAGALLLLPIQVTEAMQSELADGEAPLSWLLTVLAIVVGLPFLAVSIISPLLQRWFSRTRHRDARDPYFLYSASNLGSMLALLGYPFFLEARFDLPTQASLWMKLFVVLIGFLLVCSIVFITRARKPEEEGAGANNEEEGLVSEPIDWKRRGRWILFAFVPSSLMLGVTTYLSTDIASMPLLWVVPLSLYLLTFVLVFARKPVMSQSLVHRVFPMAAIFLIFVFLTNATDPPWMVILIHQVFFFLAAMVCHGRLAADRPSARHLTEFYLYLSIGGVLGGLFNAVLAPVVFDDVREYPLMILIACGMYVTSPRFKLPRRRAALLGAGAFVVSLVLVWLDYRLQWPLRWYSNLLIFGLPLAACFPLARRPRFFALALAGLMISRFVYVEIHKRTLFVDRSFFGVSRVSLARGGLFHQLDHGSTAHGRQFVDPARHCEPLAYYHREGPLGSVFGVFNRHYPNADVGVVGMGTGSMITYAEPTQDWTFYEIDPLVVQLAWDRRFFTYLSDCAPEKPVVIQGDARLQLQRAAEGKYQMLVLDAFSSDAIPVHLVTREAIELYFSRMAEGGWLVMHLSNRYLDLEQVMAGLAREMDLVGLSWIDTEVDWLEGKEESQWLVLAREEEDLKQLIRDPNRIPLESRPFVVPWTDSRSSILEIFKW